MVCAIWGLVSFGTPTFAVVVTRLVLFAGSETALKESTPRLVVHVAGKTTGVPCVSLPNVSSRNRRKINEAIRKKTTIKRVLTGQTAPCGKRLARWWSRCGLPVSPA